MDFVVNCTYKNKGCSIVVESFDVVKGEMIINTIAIFENSAWSVFDSDEFGDPEFIDEICFAIVDIYNRKSFINPLEFLD